MTVLAAVCFEFVIEQGYFIPSDSVTVDLMGLGKRLTWRRSQHGLVGWEMTVNSGPFSQLPVETNTTDYPAIVSKEATRHLLMLTKSYALWSSLDSESGAATVICGQRCWSIAKTVIISPKGSSISTFLLLKYSSQQGFLN